MQRQVVDSFPAGDDQTWEQLAPLLDRLIERLGRRDREAVLLRFYRQMSYAQVAQAMQCGEDAARKRVDRALSKLRAWANHKGVAVSAELMTAGMEGDVAAAGAIAPAGLVAAATIGALAGKGSAAVAASSIPIAKGAMTMMIWAKAKLVAGIALAALITTAGGVALIAATATSSPKPRELAAPASHSRAMMNGRSRSPKCRAAAAFHR